MSVVNYRVAENIAVLSLANPPVNALSRPLRQGLQASRSGAHSRTGRSAPWC